MSRPIRVPGCDVEGCDRDHDAHGYCSMHKRRWLKHGDVRPHLKGHRRDYGPVTEMDTHELAWAAGFFDGEGYVGLRHKVLPQGRWRSARIIVGQKHREVLDRFQAAVGVGKVSEYQTHSSDKREPFWRWELSHRDQVHRVMWQLWPWLSSVKRRQFEDVCSRYAELAPTYGGESHG